MIASLELTVTNENDQIFWGKTNSGWFIINSTTNIIWGEERHENDGS